jgi:hypothetical protein
MTMSIEPATSLTNRLLFFLALVLCAIVFYPARAVAEKAGGNGCSTCSSDLFDHWFAADCCLPGGSSCMAVSYPGHTTHEPGWCGDIHPECAAN